MEKKEAMKILKDFHDKSALFSVRTALDTIIPELKDSEDEKIRKHIVTFIMEAEKMGDAPEECAKWLAWLEKQGQVKESIISQHEIATCKENNDSLTGEDEKIKEAICDCVKLFSFDSCFFKYVSQEECLAWLEKQGEQKPADKVESKFKDGDWVVNKNGEPRTFKVIRRSWPDALLQEYKTGKLSHVNVMTLDKQYRLWDITKDAKDGDVLYSPCLSLLWIFKSRDTIYCGCNLYYICGVGYFERPTDAIPATKGQCDLLFSKMKEAGYEWDAEKKELKKIEQKPAEWSEEEMQLECIQGKVWTITIKTSRNYEQD